MNHQRTQLHRTNKQPVHQYTKNSFTAQNHKFRFTSPNTFTHKYFTQNFKIKIHTHTKITKQNIKQLLCLNNAPHATRPARIPVPLKERIPPRVCTTTCPTGLRGNSLRFATLWRLNWRIRNACHVLIVVHPSFWTAWAEVPVANRGTGSKKKVNTKYLWKIKFSKFFFTQESTSLTFDFYNKFERTFGEICELLRWKGEVQ